MTRFIRNAGWGLLWLALGSTAFATSFTIVSQTDNIDEGGQFSAQLGSNPVQDVLVYCVDFSNYVDFNYTMNANVGTLPTDLPDTRYGTTPESGFYYQDIPTTTNVIGTALDRYTMAGWLTTQFNLAPGQNGSAMNIAIQNAIWDLLDATGPTGNTLYLSTVNTWLQNAVNWEAGLNPTQLLAFQNTVTVYTISDVASASIPARYTTDHTLDQEMISVTPSSVPEPGSLGLAAMGGGLILLGFIRRRRA